MAKKRKRTHKTRTRRVYLPARRLSDIGEIGALDMEQFNPAIYGAITGIATAFADNMLNINPKIKGAALVLGSAFIPAPESVKGAIAGKGGEILAKSFGILSNEVSDGFALISEEEISELADELEDELSDDDLSDGEVINDDVINDEAIWEEVQI
jgi:hypothetical protein